jgi:hypothetical protein
VFPHLNPLENLVENLVENPLETPVAFLQVNRLECPAVYLLATLQAYLHVFPQDFLSVDQQNLQ